MSRSLCRAVTFLPTTKQAALTTFVAISLSAAASAQPPNGNNISGTTSGVPNVTTSPPLSLQLSTSGDLLQASAPELSVPSMFETARSQVALKSPHLGNASESAEGAASDTSVASVATASTTNTDAAEVVASNGAPAPVQVQLAQLPAVVPPSGQMVIPSAALPQQGHAQRTGFRGFFGKIFGPILSPVTRQLNNTAWGLYDTAAGLRGIEQPLTQLADINKLAAPLGGLSQPMTNLAQPLTNLAQPVTNLAPPIDRLSPPEQCWTRRTLCRTVRLKSGGTGLAAGP